MLFQILKLNFIKKIQDGFKNKIRKFMDFEMDSAKEQIILVWNPAVSNLHIGNEPKFHI
jgi:hypothetical protein